MPEPTRTTRTSVAFERPFCLDGVDGTHAAGTYALDVDEEIIEGLSFLAYRRVAKTLYLPVSRGGASVQAVRVEPSELDAIRQASVVHSP